MQEIWRKICRKLSFVISYVPDQYKTQKMCDKAVENYAHALKLALDCYKAQKMRNNALSTYPSTIIFVPKCH